MKNNINDENITLIPSLVRSLRLCFEKDVVKPSLHLSGEDLSPHHFQIMKFVDIEGHPYIGEISEESKISKAQMTNSIDKLVSLGMIIRIPDTRDRRKICLELTEKGKSVVTRMDAIVNQHMKKKLSKLSDAELSELWRALEYLITTFKKLG
jgi:DNA-binding MarR family transcriptional regulator